MAIEWRRKGTDLLYEGKVGSVLIGRFSSVTKGSGIKLSSSRTFAQRVCADDGGAALTVGSAYRAGERRLLLTGASTGDVSIYGGQDHLKVVADQSAVTGYLGGHWGHLEMTAAGKVNIAGAVTADVDCVAGSTGTTISAFLANGHDVSVTADTAIVHVPNPVTGTWDYFAVFGSAPGGIAVKSTALSGLSAAYRILVKTPDGAVGYIPIMATWA